MTDYLPLIKQDPRYDPDRHGDNMIEFRVGWQDVLKYMYENVQGKFWAAKNDFSGYIQVVDDDELDKLKVWYKLKYGRNIDYEKDFLF